MDHNTDDLVGSPIVTVAAAVLFATGAVMGLSALQVWINLEIWGPARFVPWAQAAIAAALVYTAPNLQLSSLRAASAGAALAVVAFVLNTGWLIFGVNGGFYSLLAFVGPFIALLAAITSAAAIGPTRRYQRARAALMASEGGQMFATDATVDGPWVIALLGTALLCSPVALTMAAPTVADRLWLDAGALTHGVWPTGSGIWAVERADFTYPWSPFEHYLQIEAEGHPLDVERATAWVDDIATEVGLRMITESGARDVDAAERALVAAGRQRDIPLWIARALRDRGVFYHIESLMSRSFDPARHRHGDEVHLDCDQLVYVFEHVAYRLDLDMRVMPAAMHAYVHYLPPKGGEGELLVVETTEFGEYTEDLRGRERYDLGTDFFVPDDWHRKGKGGTWASRALTEAGHLYEPADAAHVHDMILSELAVGLQREDPKRDVRGMLTPSLATTVVPELVSNLHLWTVAAAQAAFDAQDWDAAVREGQAAAALRAEHGTLLSSREPTEAPLLIDTLVSLGRGDEAKETAKAALRQYRDALETDPWRAASKNHQRVLDAAERAGVTPGVDLGPAR